MFHDFDFNALDDPEFKEDSVREEIIRPLIRKLGYQVTGNHKVVRSRTLEHPFVSIGSKRHKISIIPDYVFEVNGGPFWILDAKSPAEDISKSKHVEQAYSYAIHPEVRARYYSLCNGKEFVLYDYRKYDPVLKFRISEIEKYMDHLVRILHPEIMANPEVVHYQPDFGLAMKRLGVKPGFIFLALQVHTDFIAKIQDGLYTTSTTIPDGGMGYMASFDFDKKRYKQLLKVLGKERKSMITEALSRQPYTLKLEGEELLFGVSGVLQGSVNNNQEESYVPFTVTKFMPYSKSP